MTNMANTHDRLHTWVHTQNNSLQPCTDIYISVHAFMCTVRHVCIALNALAYTNTHSHQCKHIRCEEFITVLILNIWNHSSPMYHRLFRFDIWTAWDLFQEWSGHLDVKGAKCVSFTGFDAADVRSGELWFIFLYPLSPDPCSLYPNFNRLLWWKEKKWYLTLDLSLCLCNGLEARRIQEKLSLV